MNVTHVVLSHLKDDFLSIIRHVKGGIRKTNLVIVVTLGLVGAVGRCQNVMNHVLSGCLTVRTSYRNDINTSLFKIVGS